jgi:hypothetical protein
MGPSVIKTNMTLTGIEGDGPIGPIGITSMELTIGSKTVPIAFFVTEV